jgi:hypothetical protein
MKSIFKMAILRFPNSPSEPSIFAVLERTNYKFWILIGNYITTNDTSVLSVFFIILHFISSQLDIELRMN